MDYQLYKRERTTNIIQTSDPLSAMVWSASLPGLLDRSGADLDPLGEPHLYEASRIARFIDTESRIVVARGWGTGK